ncbi:MAG: neutral trehalase [Kiritimatiellae bacterium]|nr:neutral trehalase [Kiritimatiellia bacterium]
MNSPSTVRSPGRRVILVWLAAAGLAVAEDGPRARVERSGEWRDSVPSPVFSPDPSLVDLYWKTWELAYRNVKRHEGMPQSPYMDEACYDDAIWIWDTCFMALFCKYAPDVFPGVESLRNFYLPLHAGARLPITCHIADNPPLFAWAEWENFRFTGDTRHLRRLLMEDRFLQKHYRFFERMPEGFRLPGNSSAAVLRRHEIGFFWNGGHSGMDNTPRGRPGNRAAGQHITTHALWVDALAQQGLSALYIARALESLGERAEAAEWRKEHARIAALLNTHYWDEQDGFYYDIDADTKAFLKVKTPASFWPLLAEVCTPDQAKKLAAHLGDPAGLGGEVPWVTLARGDPDFVPNGNYWRGAIWLPTAYMGIKALENYGLHDVADETAWRVVQHMNATYRTYTPATIWECYSPTRPEPSVEYGRRARPDFCGWSALGPISLFIENIIGIYKVDAVGRTVHWRLTRSGEIGVRNLRFGGIRADLVHDGAGTVRVRSTAPFTLNLNGRSHSVRAGEQQFPFTPASAGGEE